MKTLPEFKRFTFMGYTETELQDMILHSKEDGCEKLIKELAKVRNENYVLAQNNKSKG